MKTIKLDTPLKLEAALIKLMAGECLGILPRANIKYMTLFTPERGRQRLVWQGSTDSTMLIEQLIEDWFLVIVDHRTLTTANQGAAA